MACKLYSMACKLDIMMAEGVFMTVVQRSEVQMLAVGRGIFLTMWPESQAWRNSGQSTNLRFMHGQCRAAKADGLMGQADRLMDQADVLDGQEDGV